MPHRAAVESVTLTGEIRGTPGVALCRGYWSADRRPVLVKVLRSEYPTAAEIAALRREHDLFASLSGAAGIARAIGLQKAGNGLAIVLEQVAGEPLDARLAQDGALDLPVALRRALGLAEIVASVHRHDILLGDVRPHHVFVHPETGALTLVDLGAAVRLPGQLPCADQAAGALSYTSPERTGRMNRAVDRRSDLYSLGVTLYEIFTGALPFTTTDPLQLTHSHIALAPVPPSEVLPQIPEVVSAMVMMLLRKAPEERYQSAAGVWADLEECVARLDVEGEVRAFALGRSDVSDELHIPRKLYGREAETAALRATFERVRGGAAGLLVLSGYSGVGKSALVNEIHEPVARGGRFIAGKFDQMHRGTPYAPIVDGCRQLVRSLLTAPAEVLAAWSERLKGALHPNGQLLVDLLPELGLVIGPQPPVQELGPSESQRRFELLFLGFLGVFPSAEQPLAFFLDDLQWADPASLRLLHQMLTSRGSSHLLVIGAYRDNEVDAQHPLTSALQELKKSGAILGEIKLEPLDVRLVTQLLADTLVTSLERAEPLAALLVAKTRGNPFFLNQFLTSLHKDKFLWFDPRTRAWTWEIERLEEAMATDNVVDFMVQKLRRLAPATQRALELAACIGYQFDRRTLAMISEQTPAEVGAHLQQALDEGLVVPLYRRGSYVAAGDEGERGPNPAYGFLHDRVQQVAYALIEPAQKPDVHLRIGRLLMAGEGGLRDDRLFDVVRHMNLGAARIAGDDERRALGRLNVSAGRRARDAADYVTAVRLLRASSELLGEGAWERDYDAVHLAHLILAECELVGGNHDKALQLLDLVERHARSPVAAAAASWLRAEILTNLNRLADAAACGIEAARRLGMDFPPLDGDLGRAVAAELGALRAALAGMRVESLLDLPAMTDEQGMEALKVLHGITPAANQVRPELLVLIVAKAVNLTLRLGNAPFSAYYYMMYGLVLVTSGELETSYRFAQLSFQLHERCYNRAVENAIHGVFGIFVSCWRRHLSESFVHLQRTMKAQPDNVRAGYSAAYYTAYRFFAGDGLDELSTELPGLADIAERSGNVPSVGVVKVVGQVIASLKGQTRGCGSPDGDAFDATALERIFLKTGNPLVDSNHFLFRGIARYFAANIAGASDDFEGASPAVQATFTGAEIRFYRALTRAARLRGQVGAERDVLLQELKKDEETLRTWAASAPANFGHRHALVAAELATLVEGAGDPVALYDRAVALAHENGSLAHEALANELCARHLLAQGRAKIARLYMTDAHYAYGRWGATAKVQELAPYVLTDASLTPREARGAQLDALAVVRASQAISTEILLSKLVHSLMRIVIEQAGAERGSLLLVRNAQLWVEGVAGAAAESGGFVRRRLGAASPDETPLLPHAIIDYVRRTHEKVLLADAGKDNIFSTDRYLEIQRPRSVLCLPMMRQAELIGILYLENRLTGDAFSADRVAVLEVLSAQAAISIENATLYEDMEQRIAERTRDLEASLRLIEETQEQRIEAERKAAVARLESEMAIAQRIQTSILPRELTAPGFEIAARMVTATEVGGDYYDLQPAGEGGFWMGIGDVSGHGLSAGLVMLMIQSGLASLIRRDPDGDPTALLCTVNGMIYDNVRQRIGGDDFATLSLLRFRSDGRFTVAGAHEEILLWRASSGRCEVVPTPGTWLGAKRDIEPYTTTHAHRMQPGDVLLLYTDGITEAMGEGGEQFGTGRVRALVERLHAAPVETICDQLFAEVAAWLAAPRLDDQTAVVLRYSGAS